MQIEIAVVVSDQGKYRCAGPSDFDEGEHHDAMSAARTWTLESGEMVISSWWVRSTIPDPVREPLVGEVSEAKQ